MKENKIIITISKDGSIKLETKGIKGSLCVTEVDEILKGIDVINNSSYTSEYYEQEEELNKKTRVTVGKSNV